MTPVEETKTCPYCAETIKKQAVICRFCGYDLRTGMPTARVTPPQPAPPLHTPIEWEYTDYVYGFPPPGQGLWAKLGPDAYTEAEAKLEFWQDCQGEISAELQRWIDEGWQPIGEVGSACIEIRTATGYRDKTAAYWLLMAFFSIPSFGLVLLFALIFGRSMFAEPVQFSVQMRRPASETLTHRNAPNPTYAIAYNRRGNAYDNLGQLDKALADYNAALDLDPMCAAAYYNRGRIYQKRGERDAAIADFRQAHDLYQNNPKYRQDAVDKLRELGAATTAPAVAASPPRRSRNGIVVAFLAVLLLLGSIFFVVPTLLRQSVIPVSQATPTGRAPVVVVGAATPVPMATNIPQPTAVPIVMQQPVVTPQSATVQPKSCLPPPAGLVSWWPGDGNANDIIGSNKEVLVRGVTFTAGEVGQAFGFDGNGIVLAPARGLPTGATPRTVAFWSKISPSDDTSTGFGYEPQGVTAGRGFYVFPSHSENGGRLTFSGNGSSYDVFAETDLRDGLYHHVAVTYDGKIVTMYADAIPVASGSLELDTGSETAFIGGADGGAGSQFLTGEVDEVAVWNRVLSPSEIQAMFSAGIAGMCKTR